MLNQFHDVLPGTSIARVFEDAERLYRQADAACERIVRDALEALVECPVGRPEVRRGKRNKERGRRKGRKKER